MLTRVRRALFWVLLALSMVGALVLKDPTPALLPFAMACLLRPRSDWKQGPKRTSRTAHLVTLALLLSALGLTLLMPDGLFRWTLITAIVIAYVISVLLLGRSPRGSKPGEAVKNAL